MAKKAFTGTLKIDIKPVPYQKQLEAIWPINPATKEEYRYAVIEASTKAGKTVGCLLWILDRACRMGNGRNHWWVAPIYNQAMIAYNRLKMALSKYEHLGFKFNGSNSTIELPNGAVIWFKGADRPDTLYGEDVHSAVIDEGTRCKEDAWFAVRSTLTATKGFCRIIGNVKGKKNWVYRIARKAQAKQLKNWAYAKLTAYDAMEAGIMDEAEIEDAKELPEAVFKELYMAEASDDGGNPFGLDQIKKCIQTAETKFGVIDTIGIDVAKSQDWFVIIAMDEYGNVAHLQRFQLPWRTAYPFAADVVNGLKPRRGVLVDSTGVGDPCLEYLQDHCRCKVEGFIFSGISKQTLIEGLVLDVQLGRITYPDGVLVEELEAFEFMHVGGGGGTKARVVYSAPDGYHDDTVCALALARALQRGVTALAWDW